MSVAQIVEREERERVKGGAIIAVLAFAGMGASFMQTILVPIQAELPSLLDTDKGLASWVITVTLLVSAICTPVAGRLGDMWGKRRVAITLLVLLLVGSIVCALSFHVAPMIIGRALQGAGMGVIPLGISILRDVLPPQRLGSAVALVSATLGVGGAIGLPVSAIIVDSFDWHALFWTATALSLAALIAVARVVPESESRTGGRLDIVGVIGLAAGIVALLLAISNANAWGWNSPLTIGLLAGGVVVLGIWAVLELRIVDPLVDIRVSVRPAVLFTNISSIAMGFALFASSVVFPQLLQLPAAAGGNGLSLLESSLLLMPAGLAMLAMSPVAGRIERRIGPKPLLVSGAAVIAVTYLVAALLDLEWWHVLIVNTVIGIGIGLGYAAMPALIMRAVPVNETGAANGLNTLMRSLGTSLASAIIAAVLASSVVDGFVSIGGFRLALLISLGAAVLSAFAALFIPRSNGKR
ncbi:MAG: MFS transporter [Microbacterium sp.]|uniref:MFS transporter n=1 Tax=Microbacterium sp. TaxID=51671 RepID=UPI003D6EB289